MSSSSVDARLDFRPASASPLVSIHDRSTLADASGGSDPRLSGAYVTPLQQMAASCAGALLTSLVSTPLDVVRIRLQSQAISHISSTASAAAAAAAAATTGAASSSSAAASMSAADPFARAWAAHATSTAPSSAAALLPHRRQIVCIVSQSRPSPGAALSASLTAVATRAPPAAATAAVSAVESASMAAADGTVRYVVILCNGLMDHVCNVCFPAHKPEAARLNGTFDALTKIARQEGFSSLWRGLSPTLLMAVPATMVYFTAYEQIRDWMKHSSIVGGSGWEPLLAGGVARVASATFISPLELFRTKIQSTTSNYNYRQLIQSVRQSVKTTGISSLWLGLGPTLLRDVPFSALYWWGYETTRSLFVDGLTNRGYAMDGTTSFGVSFAAGAASGMVSAAVTTPFDVIKTRSQIQLGQLVSSGPVQMSTAREIARDLYRTGGVSSLFVGLTARCAKVAPACAIMISSYELGKSFFGNRNKQRALQEQYQLLPPSLLAAVGDVPHNDMHSK
ncbi:solute carrier family 25 member 40 [Capsaspora owczarzaki ATCC 30864]|uniref:Solute carrier family 25 member 40 n=1 Tax=Capsaspora owczarzaki (strain ATCC 30864) TaxID=595528 RepID=A0A0D2WI01_CAPO3|nr:solute carrier family 25 member 40 [Capsaspora owczarzaki ATCC 30864]KJE88483.1 solute carrier family 25 member 40 [Capsaspora owczarzaki ATCC 30864]|eukprot:XP_004365006.1 solute carrier family 25 member 40 [Capsaspora owczarzaki ATCC 30864]